jgi:hypothetical protein
MRTARRLSPASAPYGHTSEPGRDAPAGRLRHVPLMHLAFDGDGAQANGVDLPNRRLRVGEGRPLLPA